MIGPEKREQMPEKEMDSMNGKKKAPEDF